MGVAWWGMAQRFPAQCPNGNIRESVSGTACNLPGLCYTVKSWDCNAIAQRFNMFDVACIEYRYLRAA